jgi:hypothetical protein
MLSSSDVERLVAKIAKLNRAEVTRRLLNFRADFPMDFTDEYLATLPLERLRHLLMAAHLHRSRKHKAAV